ncbi:TetR/AcrR family transcriptional regulator [Streptomyces iconiensis]|uniref:Helix-turn-helix domain-containing protein n=1 Tax=Streptomyces iconiensis TaxID=1384038 RepID=A0ABT7A3C9_9ACTN|nr:TetR/AcrR family transcriptional regulator [Streptomyces iconiensis]MDJ1135848.1 helix-turn-helix domain-containing protein [Streptomyces iconiensis]
MADRGVARPRADAQRNKEAVLAAADGLFARAKSAGSVSMDEVAAAAGVGKGTLFRHFGDRVGLIEALVGARITPLRDSIASGPGPLGPGTPPRERIPALLEALQRFKLDNRPLMLALEEAGRGSPYEAAHYGWWHEVLSEELAQVLGGAGQEGADEAGFAAHALLAATRADLVEQLAGREGMGAERMRASLAAYVARVLD